MSTTPGPSSKTEGGREGSLEAPTRHPLDWRNPEFYDHAALDKELERGLRHLSRLPPLLQPVQLLSYPV